jgi:hypothetical protein
MSASCAALLKCQKLLGTERLVVDLRCCLDQVLEMGAGEEVSEVDEFAVVLVLDVDDSPSVLTSTDLLAANDDRLLRSNNGEGNDVLMTC